MHHHGTQVVRCTARTRRPRQHIAIRVIPTTAAPGLAELGASTAMFLAETTGRVQLLEGDWASALTNFDRLGAAAEQFSVHNPSFAPWRARSLLGPRRARPAQRRRCAGRREPAPRTRVRIADHHRHGPRGQRSSSSRRPSRSVLLEEAVAAIAGTKAELLRCNLLIDLGFARHHAGDCRRGTDRAARWRRSGHSTRRHAVWPASPVAACSPAVPRPRRLQTSGSQVVDTGGAAGRPARRRWPDQRLHRRDAVHQHEDGREPSHQGVQEAQDHRSRRARSRHCAPTGSTCSRSRRRVSLDAAGNIHETSHPPRHRSLRWVRVSSAPAALPPRIRRPSTTADHTARLRRHWCAAIDAPTSSAITALTPGTSWQWQFSGGDRRDRSRRRREPEEDVRHRSVRRPTRRRSAGCRRQGHHGDLLHGDRARRRTIAPTPRSTRRPSSAMSSTASPTNASSTSARSTSLLPIISARLDLAVTKGCDGIEPDLDDTYNGYDTGFDLTMPTNSRTTAPSPTPPTRRGLSIGLKNGASEDGTFEAAMVEFTDWALNEECNTFDECDGYAVVHRSEQGRVPSRVHQSGRHRRSTTSARQTTPRTSTGC